MYKYKYMRQSAKVFVITEKNRNGEPVSWKAVKIIYTPEWRIIDNNIVNTDTYSMARFMRKYQHTLEMNTIEYGGWYVENQSCIDGSGNYGICFVRSGPGGHMDLFWMV